MYLCPITHLSCVSVFLTWLAPWSPLTALLEPLSTHSPSRLHSYFMCPTSHSIPRVAQSHCSCTSLFSIERVPIHHSQNFAIVSPQFSIPLLFCSMPSDQTSQTESPLVSQHPTLKFQFSTFLLWSSSHSCSSFPSLCLTLQNL